MAKSWAWNTASTAANVVMLAPSGSDDSQALQALVSTDSSVLLGPGVFLWNTAPVKLPRNATGIRIQGSGVGVTTIKLSAGAPRAFDFNKIADGDVFQNITISDLTVDCNNVGGKHHGIIGNYAAGTVAPKIAFQRIALERLAGINAPAPDASATNDRRWIVLWSSNDKTDSKLESKQITARDIDLKGGAYGIAVMASRVSAEAGNFANYEFDQILLDNCRHDTEAVPTEFIACANFQVGSRGFGKSVRINNCYGANSGDVGIEIDGMLDAVTTGTRIADQWGIAFLGTNYATVPGLQAQRFLWQGCKVRRSAQNTNKTNSYCGFRSTVTSEFTTQYPSSYIARNCQFSKADGTMAVNGEAVRVDSTRRVELDDVEIAYEAISSNEAVTVYTPSAINVRNGVAAGAMGVCHFIARKVAMRFAGERIGAAHFIFNTVLLADTGEIAFEIDGMTIDFNVTGLSATDFRGFQIGNSSAGQQTGGKLKGYRILQLAGDSAPRAVVLQDTNWITVVDRIELIDCDFSKMAGGEEVQFATSGGGTAQNAKLAARTCRPRSGSTALEGSRAAAATVKLAPQGEYAAITGETEITSIEAVPSSRRVTLQFTAATPKKVTAGSNLKLAGSYEPAKNNTLTVVCDGTNWYEASRAAVT